MIVGSCEHIALFDEKFSPSSLLNILNLALSPSGSVGLEYPCFGIPSITGGGAFFGGFGLTNEPRTQREYFACLKNTKNLIKMKLSTDHIEKAIIYYYTCRVLARVNIPLMPSFDTSRNLDEKKFWLDLTQLIKNYDPSNDYFFKMLRKQIEEKNTHTVDHNQINSLKI